MKVFVSWSGKKSRDVAMAFGGWLPSVLHAVEPFVSSKDIRAGTRWQAEIAKELDSTDFGLICITKENQAAEWLNFEAGALAKSVDFSRVIPLAIDLSPADIANPLGQFQAMKLTQEDITEVLISMNEACPSPISDANLRKGIDKWWPDLQEILEEVERREYGPKNETPAPSRSDRELLEEVLDSVRSLGRTPMRPRPTEGEPDNRERAIDELKMLMVQSGIRAWRTKPNGNDVIVETRPDSDHDLRQKAYLIGTERGVSFHFESLETPSNPIDQE
jgi:hypothetical protein